MCKRHKYESFTLNDIGIVKFLLSVCNYRQYCISSKAYEFGVYKVIMQINTLKN